MNNAILAALSLFNVSLLAFTTATPGIYQVQNCSSDSVVISKDISRNPGASAGWNSTLDVGNTLIMKIPQKQWHWQCLNAKTYKSISCKNVRIKKLKGITLPHNLQDGGFFITENQPISKINQAIKQRDVKLTSPIESLCQEQK